MNKQWKKLLFVVLLVFLLTACGIQSVEQHEKMEEAERSIEEPARAPIPQLPAKEEEPAELVKEEAASKEEIQQDVQPVKVEDKTEVKVEAEPKPKGEVSEPKQEVKPAPKPELKEEVKPAPVKEPIKQAAEQPKEEPKLQSVEKKHTVTIAIYVHSLVANMDKLHPSLTSEKYVPASGIVLKPVTYELLSEKDTVWDILRRATKEHKIQLEYEGADENIYDSVYIEGINHLYEFSAGPLSGWMYKVNGTFPNYGASQYTLEDGDVIEWHYTVDLGRDLGKDV